MIEEERFQVPDQIITRLLSPEMQRGQSRSERLLVDLCSMLLLEVIRSHEEIKGLRRDHEYLSDKVWGC